MIRIQLTQGKTTLIDADDYGLISGFKWCHAATGEKRAQHYAVSDNGLRMHRLIMDAPKGMDVDHINGNGLDNRRSNLRICTRSQNLMNRGKLPSGKNKYKGVRFTNGKYQATIIVGGKHIYIGRFKNIKAAALAYDLAALQYHNEFARLNFPEIKHTQEYPKNFCPSITQKNNGFHRKTI